MIRLLKGTIFDRNEKTLTLLVGGVGYYITVPSSLETSVGTEQTLWIHTHVREDILALYGFGTKEDLAFFELLITVNGIGPKMAMEIMNEPASIVQNAIFTGDIQKLTRTPGVGKKLAERLVLELKGKIEPKDLTSLTEKKISLSSYDEDAIAALESLGYKRKQIESAFASLPELPSSTEAWIKAFLQRI